MTFAELDKLRIEKFGVFSDDPDALRMRRSTSWGVAAEKAQGDDERFMFLWIAFNALYHDASSVSAAEQPSKERDMRRNFFVKVCELDDKKLVCKELIKIPNQFRVFVDNIYVYNNYWKTVSGDWTEEKFEEYKKYVKNKIYNNLMTATADEEVELLDYLFSNMAVLRNQIFHGLATYESAANREQLRAGLAILGGVVPIIVEMVLKSDGVDWGTVSYPYIKK